MANIDKSNPEVITYINKKFKAAILSGKLIDVTFIVGPEKVRIAANKALLALSSKVFSKQLFGKFYWFNDGSENEVIICDANPSAFQYYISFLSFGKTDCPNEIVKEVYELADRYSDNKLKKNCENQIISMIHYKNIFQIASWNKLFENETIKTAISEYFQKNQMPCLLSDIEGFNTLHKDKVFEIVKMRVLNCSEELLLERVLEWKKANEDQTIDDLMTHIRLEVDEEYQIVDYFSKGSRMSDFDKKSIKEMIISENLVFTTSDCITPAYCIGFSIILSNILKIKNHVEEFNIKIYFKSNGLVFYDRDFITKVENEVVVQEHIFKFPLRFYNGPQLFHINMIDWRVTFKKAANRYHYCNEVLFPFKRIKVTLFDKIDDADIEEIGYKIVKEN